MTVSVLKMKKNLHAVLPCSLMHTRPLYASQCTHQNAWENRERDRPHSNSTSGAKFTEQSHVFPHGPRKYPTTNYSTLYLFEYNWHLLMPYLMVDTGTCLQYTQGNTNS